MSYPVSPPGAPPGLPPRSAPQQIPACSVVFSGQHYPVCSVPPPVSVCVRECFTQGYDLFYPYCVDFFLSVESHIDLLTRFLYLMSFHFTSTSVFKCFPLINKTSFPFVIPLGPPDLFCAAPTYALPVPIAALQ